jgi:aerobic-type carbon monoxide dehydrogenase small subunit (CoxS/CutS family)
VCGRGECGACTVLIDRVSAYSCLTLTAACADRSITTVEGLANGDTLNRVQAAFIEHDALQCGFCTPGQIMAAVALLGENPNPSEADVRRGMSGNLCRCGTYPKIIRAVLAAAGPANG